MEKRVLSEKQLKNWEQEGFLILKNFISEKSLSGVEKEVEFFLSEGRKSSGTTMDFLDGPCAGQRMPLSKADSQLLQDYAIKLNSLFLESEIIRKACLEDSVTKALEELLEDDPVLFQTLNFIRGSGQPVHVDTWFLPPPEGGEMIAIWICLEDVQEDAGPLVYIPGSHKMKQYEFSNGSTFHVADEVPKAVEKVGIWANENGLPPKTFLAKRGDMFIWHQHLAHGGAYRPNGDKTRKSQVAHFFNRASLHPTRVSEISPNKYIIVHDANELNTSNFNKPFSKEDLSRTK